MRIKRVFFRKDKARSRLEDAHVQKIATLFHDYREVAGVAHVAEES